MNIPVNVTSPGVVTDDQCRNGIRAAARAYAETGGAAYCSREAS